MNTKKIQGLLLCACGVMVAKSKGFFAFSGAGELALTVAGTVLSFAGLAVFASGIKNRTDKIIRMCAHCFYKNEADSTTCVKCKRPLIHNQKAQEPFDR